jgi:hypothetical protein
MYWVTFKYIENMDVMPFVMPYVYHSKKKSL